MPNIQSNHRVFFTGKTRSGKTTAARIISSKLNRLIVFDPKNQIDNDEWNLEDATDATWQALDDGEEIRMRVVPPVENVDLFWIEQLTKVFEAQNCTLYIDELYMIVPPGTKSPAILSALWTQGGGLNIGVWSCSQRPTLIPLFAISESEHWFMFRLTNLDDRQRMASFMTDAVIAPIKDKHGFWYMSVDDDAPIYRTSILETEE